MEPKRVCSGTIPILSYGERLRKTSIREPTVSPPILLVCPAPCLFPAYPLPAFPSPSGLLSARPALYCQIRSDCANDCNGNINLTEPTLSGTLPIPFQRRIGIDQMNALPPRQQRGYLVCGIWPNEVGGTRTLPSVVGDLWPMTAGSCCLCQMDEQTIRDPTRPPFYSVPQLPQTSGAALPAIKLRGFSHVSVPTLPPTQLRPTDRPAKILAVFV